MTTTDVGPPPNYPAPKHATHSFSHSPSVPQMVAYCFICCEIVVYFGCLHSINPNYILFGFYCASTVLMLVFAAICSFSNPTDSVVYLYKWHKYDKSVKFEPNYNQNCYCEYCESFCHLNSKHCRICNRCASHFDHHCIWINNCIGGKNYRVFMLLIVFTFLHVCIYIISAVIMTKRYVDREEDKISRAIPVWVVLCLHAIVAVFLLQLIALHFYLIFRGITTYEFLQEKRRKQIQNTEPQSNKNQDQDIVIERRTNQHGTQTNRDRSPSQAESSNVQIQMTEFKTLRVEPKNKISPTKGAVNDQTSEVSSIEAQIANNRNDKIEEECVAEQMPQFLKNSRSLKLLFGSDLVEAPRSSRKRLETLD